MFTRDDSLSIGPDAPADSPTQALILQGREPARPTPGGATVATISTLPVVSLDAPGDPGRVTEGFFATSCRSPHSRRAMTRALEAIAHELSEGRQSMRDFPWARLDRDQVTRLYRALADGVQGRPARAASANQMLTALRGVLLEAWRQGSRTREDNERTLDGLDTFPANTARRGRALDMGEVLQLFRSCAQDTLPARAARDAALLAVLYGRGLRRAEVAVLSLTDYLPHPELPGTHALRVLGKGNKQRWVPIDGNVKPALDSWLSVRGAQLDGIPGATDPSAPLFTMVKKGGRVAPKGLTAHAIYTLLRRRARHAGVRAFSPHDLRRSCISDLLDAQADIAAVAALVGHSQVSTTQAYDRRGARAVVSAAGRLHVPYVSAIER